MKKLFTNSCITLALQSFSFVPLSGPYYIIKEGEVVEKRDKETLTQEQIFNDSYYPEEYFLYNRSTSTMMTFKMPSPKSYNWDSYYDALKNVSRAGLYKPYDSPLHLLLLNQFRDLPSEPTLPKSVSSYNRYQFTQSINKARNTTLEFFTGNNTLELLKGFFAGNEEENTWSGKMKFCKITSINPIPPRVTFLFRFQKGEFSLKEKKMILKNTPIDLTPNLYPSSCVNSLSNVKIENRDNQVILSQGDKNIELREALKKYFETIPPKVWDDTIHSFQRFPTGSSKAIFPQLAPYMDYLNIQDRLDQSKILAVWGLISTEVEEKDSEGQIVKKTIQSQIVGLAEDKNGKLFHWITDLKKDISELMQYAE